MVFQGEAKVIKHMKTKSVDQEERRRKISSEARSQDPFLQAKRIVDFISDKNYSKYDNMSILHGTSIFLLGRKAYQVQ